MTAGNILPIFDATVFQDSHDFDALNRLLESLDHVKAIQETRENYEKREGHILVPMGEDRFGTLYNLYLPGDLKVGELFQIIDKLTTKFGVEEYAKMDELINHVKIMVAILCRSMGDESEKYLEDLAQKYNVTEALIKRISAHKIKPEASTKTLIKSIKAKSRSKKLGTGEDREEELTIGGEALSTILKSEFHLTFLREGLNLLRSGMKTFTQKDHDELIGKKAELGKEAIILLNDNPELLNTEEQLLRDKIGIDRLKEELKNIRNGGNKQQIEEKEIEVTNTILKILREYPYQKTPNDYGAQPRGILEHKETHCVAFALLAYTFLQECAITHKVLTVYGFTDIPHLAIAVNIGKRLYYFDAKYKHGIEPFTYGAKCGKMHTVILIPGSKHLYFHNGDTENILLSRIYRNRGLILGQKGEPQLAIKMYKSAIDIDHENPNSYYELGNILKNSEFYDKALELFPAYMQAYIKKGEYFLSKKNYKLADLYNFVEKAYNEGYAIGRSDTKEQREIRQFISWEDFEGLRLYLLGLEKG